MLRSGRSPWRFQPALPASRRPRAGRDGLRHRLPAVHAPHVESVRAPAARAARRQRPEPAAAGPGHGGPPADALHGLRRLLGGLRLRGRRAARRQARRRLGALVAALDHRRLVFLTIGITLGSGWAYYVLGWGGWWFWDPVENASFMPWLAGTALIHSLAVTEKRGASRPGPCCSHPRLLAVAARHLPRPLGRADVGARLRHRSAARRLHPRLPGLVVGGSLTLFAWRAPRVGLGARFALVSRETMLLGNNVLLVVACGSVLLGTLYPLLLDALGLGKLSVGPPYFETVFVPLMAPVVFLMGWGRWRAGSRAPLPDSAAPALGRGERGRRRAASPGCRPVARRRARLAAGGLDHRGHRTDLCERLRPPAAAHQRAARAPRLAARAHRHVVAHLGVAVFVFGVTMVRGYEVERDVRMAVGDTSRSGGYDFAFRGVHECTARTTGRAGALRHARRQAARRCCIREAHLHRTRSAMTETAIDTAHARHLRRWASRRRRRAGACASRQALRRLDLGRVPADGAGGPHRGQRPALSARRQSAGAGRRGACAAGGMKRLWFLMPLRVRGAGGSSPAACTSIRARCPRR